jgi:hypothetical protein
LRVLDAVAVAEEVLAGREPDVGLVGEQTVDSHLEVVGDLGEEIAKRVRVALLRYCSGRNWFSARNV